MARHAHTKKNDLNDTPNFQEIIDGIVDPFYIIDMQDYRIVGANKAARQLKISPGCLCYSALHHSEGPCHEQNLPCPLAVIKETLKPAAMEHVHFDPKGSAHYFEINAYPVFDQDGHVKQILEHIIDITDRKRHEQAVRESEKRYRQLYEASRDGYILVDMNGHIREFNHTFQEMLGYKAPEVKALNCWDITPPRWHPAEKKILEEQVLSLGYSELYEKEFIRKDGTLVPVELRTSLLHDDNGNPSSIWSFVRDITERKEADGKREILRKQIETEKRKLEQVLSIDQTMSSISNLNHLVDFVIEKATEILEVERCSLMLLDHTSKELTIRGAKGVDANHIMSTRIKMGEPLAGIVAQEGRPLLVNNIEEEKMFSRPNRQGYKNKSFMIAPITLQNKLVGVVNVADKKSPDGPSFAEIDLRILCTIVRQAATSIENATNYRELEYLSVSDPLTGIYNYRYFIRTLDTEIERANRYHGNLCLLMLDIDNFKSYNDDFGHLEGDILLKRISTVFKNNLRAVDIVCRYAGDEFVAVLPQTDIDQARIVASKVTESIKNLKGKRPVSVSIGAGEYSKHSDRRDMILKTDQALYQAKREGKGRICCFR